MEFRNVLNGYGFRRVRSFCMPNMNAEEQPWNLWQQLEIRYLACPVYIVQLRYAVSFSLGRRPLPRSHDPTQELAILGVSENKFPVKNWPHIWFYSNKQTIRVKQPKGRVTFLDFYAFKH